MPFFFSRRSILHNIAYIALTPYLSVIFTHLEKKRERYFAHLYNAFIFVLFSYQLGRWESAQWILSFFLAKRINIFKKTEAVFTVLSSNFKQLQRLKYKIPEKWLSEFQSYIYTCSIEPESRSEHFKKKQDVLNRL